MVKYVVLQLKIPRMTRKVPAKTTKVLSGYCVVVAENNEGKIKLFGSPADHPSLEMGDEILEVNGKKLEDASHSDVINHIHESIKSRRVSLKVRRRKGRRLVDEFPTYSIQNAYIVSSDDETRENFDRLHKMMELCPLDMTNLLTDGRAEDLTIPNAKLDAGISVVQPAASPLETVPESDFQPSPTENNQAVPETVFPDIPEPPRSKEDLLQRTLRNIETCIQLSKKQEGVRFCIAPDEEEFPVRVLPEVQFAAANRIVPVYTSVSNLLHTHQPTNSAIETTLGASPVEEMAAQIQFSNHREMAIDVPESFVGSIKRPPRYPSSHKDHPFEPAAAAATPVLPSPAMQDAERIKSYQADFRKRNEEEQSRARKDEFLRNSLRESKKLQALEKNAKPPSPPGFLNPAFEEEMHAHGHRGHDASASHNVPDAQSMKLALDQISNALRRENGEFAEELSFLHALFDTPEFQNAADLHHLLESRQIGLSDPVTMKPETAETLMETVKRILPGCSNQEAQELQAILSTPQFENLLLTHDKLAAYRDELAQVQPRFSDALAVNGNFRTSVEGHTGDGVSGDAVSMPFDENGHGLLPPTSTSPSQSNYVGVDMRVVKIEKTGGNPLGATIKIDPQTGGVMVARIVHGGAAQKSGLLHENDELLDVNGFDLRGKSLDEVCEMLNKMTGTLTFVIIPAQATLADVQPKRDYIMHVKAHFDFNPGDDTYPEEVRCPCSDLGLAFRKGDILHVRNHDDRNWWQAYREGEEIGSTLAGLIPSKDFQQQREDHRLRKMGDGLYMNGGKGTGKRHGSKHFGIKKPKAKKRKKVVAGSPLDVDAGETPWYEEVGVYYPKQNQKRPIILIGPHHVGRQELRERLMATDIERFAPVTPHTTRPRREGEVNGYTYFFVTRHQFEEDIARARFVEHGEFEKHLYGTSFDAIRDVALKGKICILNLQPQSLRLLRASDLKPYVVFIAPPSLDKLRLNRQKMGSYPKDDELKAIIEDAREMEDTYGHFFDLVIVNTDFDKAFAELLDEINRLEREPQWIPVEWLR
ncbi:LOW QUALITY PROTEIN: protein PALS1-like [Paramacrobiotus metropolitanus]|uniref:LOW QUALITY PROTEIN: protein PALS1-like n=1 Tax=Paramacrobiotus metropolitanus TaxID=2943436 RepID=UPI002446480D|nr:LOW QUALITY PROTEIN: protein PALS1-like [Paramacrobiotus metropolitanus]